MRNDRRVILHLVAMGRITPAEAERLLIVWNEGREVLWVAVLCVAALILSQLPMWELLPGLARAAHGLLGSASHLSHHALALIIYLLGGVL
jgi:hypothetical protein